MLVASLSQCSTDLLASSAASAHTHTVMSVHVCTGSAKAVFSLCCWHCWWASGSIWSVRFGFVICRLNAISNVFSTSLNLLSSSTPKKRDGYSQPRQPAWTNRYLSKVHWWIYSVLLTTEISNNLSEMPNPMLDISCALTPHLLFSYSWCQLQPPPHTSHLSPSAGSSVSRWLCEGWSIPFILWFNGFLGLHMAYRRVKGPSSQCEQLPLKEWEMERAQASSVSSPSALPPLSSGLDLTQQLLVIWLCETSEAISEQQLTLWLSYSLPVACVWLEYPWVIA